MIGMQMNLWGSSLVDGDDINIVAEVVDGVLVVSVVSESLTFENVAAFRLKMAELLKGQTQVVLCLSELRFVDSSGICSVLSCSSALAAVNGSLRLCCLSDPVKNILEFIKADRAFRIFPTREQAVNSFKD